MTQIMCGLDEAGRGPIAGPVCAGAVILPPDFPVQVLNDSKKLSEKKRFEAEKIIKERCVWGLGIVDHETIDKINILQASLYAMSLAFEMLLIRLPAWCEVSGCKIEPENIFALADGTFCPKVSCPCRAEAKADGKYPAVMAASIIAKTARDRLMIEYDKQFPKYKYSKHKGYPTLEHRKICREQGPSPIQRLTFKY
ncbi:ribonuclease HII [Treponema parvum]|uniref:ribonuclease HII n=1 Tax=Treponema parvum TaxID=138851 RepID=UPI001AEC3398|nr:ribonuclease HII [Treponema parvum]QTQ15999.1 ribonuclease HII [Treponema parvum]